MRLLRAMVAAVALLTVGVAGAETVYLEVTNPLGTNRPGAVVVAPASVLGEFVASGAYTGYARDANPMPVQADDLDGDGGAEEIAFVLDLGPSETLTVAVDTEAPWEGTRYTEARTSWRYEQYAAMDTDRIAYGQYGVYAPLKLPSGLQWDCYGKRPKAWSLCLDALRTVNYHNDNPVAVDFLIVGNSLGLGGLLLGEGRPVNGKTAQFSHEVIANGPVRAGIRVIVADWTTPTGGKYRGVADYMVYAHNDFIDAMVSIEPEVAKADHFGAGMIKLDEIQQFLGSKTEGILAQWGQQDTIVGETGLGIIFPPGDFYAWRYLEDESSYGFLLSPDVRGDRIVEKHLRFVGVWEHGGIADGRSFMDHLRGLATRLREPVTVRP